MRARRGGLRGRRPGRIDGVPTRPAAFRLKVEATRITCPAALRLKAEATRITWPAALRLKAEATRITWGAAFLICVAALFAPACRGISPPAVTAANAEDFHYSDPKTIAATGRPQLVEFVGPT